LIRFLADACLDIFLPEKHKPDWHVRALTQVSVCNTPFYAWHV
jgi:hypothetical protein